MEIQDFKNEVTSWPRTAGGRLVLNLERQARLKRAFADSGLNLQQFADLTGLNSSTIYKVLKRRKPKAKTSEESSPTFKPVQVKNEMSPSWQLSGPSGLRVDCATVSQVAELWRALC